jgi:hypothetical protein
MGIFRRLDSQTASQLDETGDIWYLNRNATGCLDGRFPKERLMMDRKKLTTPRGTSDRERRQAPRQMQRNR